MSRLFHLDRLFLALVVALLTFGASALEISNRYRSPRNPERRVRSSTQLIVLHTTEAPARSSLNKLSERGEAHYCVTEEGSIYRIVDRDRLAFHAGRSMWNGREDVDNYSIGIECVGYHNKPMSTIQLRAIRDLVKHLQTMYGISDDRVVCHSHVAYGMPNKWQRRRHRGRKRCGMLFAMPSVRRQLGLKTRPGGDLDTRTGRLAVGDDYLRQVLYGRIDTMAGRVSAAPRVAATPSPPKRKTAPAAPRASAAPSPQKKKPVSRPTTLAQLKTQGYRLLGCVSQANTAAKIAGAKWNAADTYYTIRNRVLPGNTIDAAHIERGMGVWRK